MMEEILYAKVNSCSQFKRALLDSKELILIEGTMDEYGELIVQPITPQLPYSC